MALCPPQLGSGQPRAPMIPYLSGSQRPLPLIPSAGEDFDAADDPFTQQARLEGGDINPTGVKPRPDRPPVPAIIPVLVNLPPMPSRVARLDDLPLPSVLGAALVEFQCKRGHVGPTPAFLCPQGCALCTDCLKRLVQESKQVYPRCECGRVIGLAEKASLSS